MRLCAWCCREDEKVYESTELLPRAVKLRLIPAGYVTEITGLHRDCADEVKAAVEKVLVVRRR